MGLLMIPNNFVNERIYICNWIFNEILGLKFEIVATDISDYCVLLSNNKELWIKDSFFSKIDESEGYLSQANLPKKVKWTTNQFTIEKDIPIIYGNEDLQISENCIVCGIDIFSSSFFMLTRWEEYVIHTRDSFGRFPLHASLAYQNGFLDRPVVNEYIEILWSMMLYLGFEHNRKQWVYETILTHDVDQIYLWSNWKKVFRTMSGDIINRKNVKLAFTRINQYYKILKEKENDPYDTFDEIMDLSELANIKSRFYFMSGGVTKNDNYYDINSSKASTIIKRIQERNHIIGFHPSFNSYKDPEQWRMEKELLVSITQSDIKEGRQHYLRFDVPTTWRIWDENQMEMDCSLGYPEKEGFRCGTCFEFPAFDILSRKELSIRESPLLFMDASLEYQDNVTIEEAYSSILDIKKKVKKYKGKFNFLWHNSNLNHGRWQELKPLYKSFVLHK